MEKENNLTIALIINTHNAENFIENLLQKIYKLKGFNPNIHHIYIYDDCSEDNTLNILENLKIRYEFQINSSNVNIGLLNARNQSIKYIKNENFLFFIDHDDDLDENILLEFYKNKDQEVLILKRKFIYENGTAVHNNWYNYTNNKYLDFIFYTPAMYITGIFIHKNIYSSPLFDISSLSKINMYEDIPRYITSILLAKKVCYLNAYYLYNRKNENSLIRLQNTNDWFVKTNEILQIFNNLKIWDSSDSFFLNVKFVINVRLLFFLLESNQWKIDSCFKDVRNKILKNKIITNNIMISKNDKFKIYIMNNRFLSLIFKFIMKFKKSK